MNIKRAREKILSHKDISDICNKLKKQNKIIVFTNGCFDILHLGHLRYLEEAKEQGDILVVGINSDRSVKKLKGHKRPIIPEHARSEMVAGLHCVDFVTVFDDTNPLQLIKLIKPDVLVKGSDWDLDKIVGKNFVESYGGKVYRANLLPEFSTTSIIQTIIHQSSLTEYPSVCKRSQEKLKKEEADWQVKK